MKISIIIPVYNAERFLEECLNSVISQNIKEKEIICIDDGSSDNSYEILQHYQKKYSYIRIFKQENKGAGEARNIGLKEALGKYVCFLDADDFYIDSNALQKMVCACEENQLYACAGLRKLYKENSIEDFSWCRNYFKERKNPEGIILQYKEHQEDYFYTNYIFNMEVIRKNKILFPPYRRYEDPPFFLNIMLMAKKYMVLPVELYGYRFPEEAISRKETHVEDTLRGIRDNIKTAQENQLYDLEEILIGRIGLEYAGGISRNANQNILRLLQEIERIVFERKDRKEIEESQVKLFYNALMLAKMHLRDINIGSYFAKRGITNVAVYGLGNYGRLIVDELKKSKKISIYGVDQKIKNMSDVRIDTLEEVNKKCADIIVTPAKENDNLVNEIKKVWKGNVWGVNALLVKVNNQREGSVK